MSGAYYRYRYMDQIAPSFALRLRVPASGFGVLSAFNPQYGLRFIRDDNDDRTWISYHSFGDDRPGDYDRRRLAFDGNKDVSEPQCRKFVDVCEKLIEHAWINRQSLTKDDVYNLTLAYLPSEYNERLKWNQRHYEVKFLNETFISEPFPEWERTRGSNYDVERLLERLFLRVPLIAYEYTQFYKWPGS